MRKLWPAHCLAICNCWVRPALIGSHGSSNRRKRDHPRPCLRPAVVKPSLSGWRGFVFENPAVLDYGLGVRSRGVEGSDRP
jgi:hypothetical protein